MVAQSVSMDGIDRNGRSKINGMPPAVSQNSTVAFFRSNIEMIIMICVIDANLTTSESSSGPRDPATSSGGSSCSEPQESNAEVLHLPHGAMLLCTMWSTSRSRGARNCRAGISFTEKPDLRPDINLPQYSSAAVQPLK
ncbi:hypothetical protein E2P81_ATG03793 [Venturia nashicola]|uniref:Uncharacterized protein n=1 Tax=Venturia nashicola TaxID=86259 RepID=A0A4Z1PK54_9PEZI|nr:hypothetical protein E6O75_ATG03879 [Venturia nashicola]TLD38118.1 hypothetical protein E2P81_ATG03793 [Venturia nashicola]